MLLREVEYARPASVDEAVVTSSRRTTRARLAGGQTLVNVMKARVAAPEVLVDLNGLDELRGTRRATATLEIGAMATYAEHRRLGEARRRGRSSPTCARTIADVQVRNRGTIGGNICSNDPTNHLPPLLAALGAR